MQLRAGLPADDVQRVLSRCRRRTFKRGEVVFHEGDLADALHFIAKGRVAVHVTTPLGETATIEIQQAGDVFGEQALIPPVAPRAATIVALEPTETLALAAAEFEALRDEHPSVDRIMLAIFARRYRALLGRLLEALYVPADKRMLRRVLEAAAVYDGDVVPLTQEDLAGLAGTTRETVNRVLRREQDAGALGLARGRITVLDPTALERRSR